MGGTWRFLSAVEGLGSAGMHRLFVALRPPEHVRDQLIDLMEGIGGARWQSEDQLHVTLRFIGEVDRHVANDVVAALGAIHHPAFELAVSGLGCFERGGKPHTLWAGVTPPEPVHLLHKKVDQAIARVGLPPERRAFHPHVTLARLNRATGPVHDFISRTGGVAIPPFTVDAFILYESQLTPAGAVYTEVERYRLD